MMKFDLPRDVRGLWKSNYHGSRNRTQSLPIPMSCYLHPLGSLITNLSCHEVGDDSPIRLKLQHQLIAFRAHFWLRGGVIWTFHPPTFLYHPTWCDVGCLRSLGCITLVQTCLLQDLGNLTGTKIFAQGVACSRSHSSGRKWQSLQKGKKLRVSIPAPLEESLEVTITSIKGHVFHGMLILRLKEKKGREIHGRSSSHIRVSKKVTSLWWPVITISSCWSWHLVTFNTFPCYAYTAHKASYHESYCISPFIPFSPRRTIPWYTTNRIAIIRNWAKPLKSSTESRGDMWHLKKKQWLMKACDVCRKLCTIKMVDWTSFWAFVEEIRIEWLRRSLWVDAPSKS